MTYHHFLFSTLLLSGIAQADYARCVLDKLPGTMNDVAANAIMQTCQQENPGGILAVEQGSGRGFFGYKNGAACTAKLAADTRSHRAAQLIRQACVKLYDDAPPGLKPYYGDIDSFLSEPSR